MWRMGKNFGGKTDGSTVKSVHYVGTRRIYQLINYNPPG